MRRSQLLDLDLQQHALPTQVPIEVVNTLAESALETQDVLRLGRAAPRMIETDT